MQTFRIIPWQLGSAGLLAFITAVGGGYLMVAPAATKDVWVPESKTLLLPTSKDDGTAPLKEELNRLTLAQRQAEEKLNQLKIESAQLLKSREDQQAVIRQQQESAGSPLPEEQALKTLVERPPDWQSLGLPEPELNLVASAWKAPASDQLQPEQEALALLEKNRTQVIQQAEQNQSGVQKTQEQRLMLLTTLKTNIKTKQTELLSSLDLSTLKDDEITSLKQAITSLMQGTLRAVPGKNFTNSVGMEMVWVPFKDTGFWIGKSEVKMDEFKQVLPAESGNCTTDSEGLVYMVMFSEADKFCKVLTQNERNGEALTSGQICPDGWAYQLPLSGHWNYARQTSNTQGLGLENLEDGVSELMADSANAGSKYRVVFGSSPNSHKSGNLNSGPKEIPDARTFKKFGTDKNVTESSLESFSGLVGFRVALLPAK